MQSPTLTLCGSNPTGAGVVLGDWLVCCVVGVVVTSVRPGPTSR